MFFHTFQIQHENVYNNIFYYSSQKTRFSNIENVDFTTDVIAHVQFFTSDDSEEARITVVNVNKEYQGKGLATNLLKKVFEYLRNLNFISIVLDDMTDNYRKSNNLYLKLGFEYQQEYGPEMIKLL